MVVVKPLNLRVVCYTANSRGEIMGEPSEGLRDTAVSCNTDVEMF